MLRVLEAFLRENEFRVLTSSSQVDEPRAQEWHRKMGFQECGTIAGINKGGIREVFFTNRSNDSISHYFSNSGLRVETDSWNISR